MQQIYMGFKPIHAVPMNRQAYNDFRGWTLPADENGADDGYLVEYLDGGQANTPQYAGYVSWSPKEVFERAYRPSGQMSFGMAIEALKMGHSLQRAGWNGKNQFVYLVPANRYPVQTGAAKRHFGEDTLVPYNAYLALKGVDGTVSTWVPSINDTLAEDWGIVT